VTHQEGALKNDQLSDTVLQHILEYAEDFQINSSNVSVSVLPNIARSFQYKTNFHLLYYDLG
jgi:hypothetical protein